MGIYLFFGAFFFLLSFLEVNRTSLIFNFKLTQQFFAWAMAIALIMLIGLRWETATDWGSYFKFFTDQKDVDFFEPNEDFEMGYVYITRVALSISNNYSLFLLLHASIFCGFLFLCYKYFIPEYVIVGVMFYFAIYIGMTGSNRQLLSLVIGLFGVVQLTKGRVFFFLSLVALAFWFHTTAVLFLVYLVLNRKLPKWLWIAIIATSVIIGLSSLPTKIFGMASLLGDMASGKVDYYSDTDAQSGSIFGYLKRLMLVVVFMLFSDRIRAKHQHFDICVNGFFFSVVMFFLFVQLPVMGRANLYFNIMEPILMVFLFDLFKERTYKNFLLGLYMIMAVFYFKQSIQLYPDLFMPYKGIWINGDYMRKELE